MARIAYASEAALAYAGHLLPSLFKLNTPLGNRFMGEYHVWINDRAQGPYELAQIRAMAPKTLVSSDKGETWKTRDEITPSDPSKARLVLAGIAGATVAGAVVLYLLVSALFPGSPSAKGSNQTFVIDEKNGALNFKLGAGPSDFLAGGNFKRTQKDGLTFYDDDSERRLGDIPVTVRLIVRHDQLDRIVMYVEPRDVEATILAFGKAYGVPSHSAPNFMVWAGKDVSLEFQPRKHAKGWYAVWSSGTVSDALDALDSSVDQKRGESAAKDL